MLELYDIIWRDKEVVGCLEYDTEKNSFMPISEKEQGAIPAGCSEYFGPILRWMTAASAHISMTALSRKHGRISMIS